MRAFDCVPHCTIARVSRTHHATHIANHQSGGSSLRMHVWSWLRVYGWCIFFNEGMRATQTRRVGRRYIPLQAGRLFAFFQFRKMTTVISTCDSLATSGRSGICSASTQKTVRDTRPKRFATKSRWHSILTRKSRLQIRTKPINTARKRANGVLGWLNPQFGPRILQFGFWRLVSRLFLRDRSQATRTRVHVDACNI